MLDRLGEECIRDKPLNEIDLHFFVMKYCPTSTTRTNPASIQNLLTLLSGESDLIRI